MQLLTLAFSHPNTQISILKSIKFLFILDLFRPYFLATMKPLHQSFASPSGTVSLDPRSPGGGKIRARHSSGESDAPSPCPSSKAGGDDEGYKAQRSRNNEAVRKSRERTKVKSQNAEQVNSMIRRVMLRNKIID
jgi:hypothetical protein